MPGHPGGGRAQGRERETGREREDEEEVEGGDASLCLNPPTLLSFPHPLHFLASLLGRLRKGSAGKRETQSKADKEGGSAERMRAGVRVCVSNSCV